MILKQMYPSKSESLIETTNGEPQLNKEIFTHVTAMGIGELVGTQQLLDVCLQFFLFHQNDFSSFLGLDHPGAPEILQMSKEIDQEGLERRLNEYLERRNATYKASIWQHRLLNLEAALEEHNALIMGAVWKASLHEVLG